MIICFLMRYCHAVQVLSCKDYEDQVAGSLLKFFLGVDVDKMGSSEESSNVGLFFFSICVWLVEAHVFFFNFKNFVFC